MILMVYWLLTTHLFSFFPIIVFLWSWKTRKESAAIFMIIKFLFVVSFSLLYHSHISLGDDRITTDYDYDNWSLLDGYSSSTLIFTTILYCSRVREPQFYITSSTVESIVLIFYLWWDLAILINAWFLTVCSIFVLVIKWRTIWRYLLKFKCLCFLTISCGITAVAMYLKAYPNFHNFQFDMEDKERDYLSQKHNLTHFLQGRLPLNHLN